MDSRDATCGSREQAGWTKERPTEPGWYWAKHTVKVTSGFQEQCRIVLITEYQPTGSKYVQFAGTDEDQRLDSFDAEWYGPILPPPD